MMNPTRLSLAMPHFPTWLSVRSLVIVCNLLLCGSLYHWLTVPHEIKVGLCILTCVALFWFTQAIHMTVTALFIPILAVVMDVFDTTTALSYFAHPIIFLFLAGFALATALAKQGIDLAITHRLFAAAKGQLRWVTWSLFAMSAFLSMWMSNTATTAMMLPLVLGVIAQLPEAQQQRTGIFMLLGVAYSASIGGMATLIGSPPNAIAAHAANLSFMDWMRVALPTALLLLPLMIGLLNWLIKPDLSYQIQVPSDHHVPSDPIRWHHQQKMTLLVFVVAIGCWVLSQPLNAWLGPFAKFDTVIALAIVIALHLLRIIEWRDLEKNTAWGILLLFGGGICLSAILQHTGTAAFLATGLSQICEHYGPFTIALVLMTSIVFLTEIVSNTALSAIFIPLFASIAPNLGLSTPLLCIMLALGSSCAFILPIATPPNAIVFATKRIPQQQMMKIGSALNLLCILVLTCILVALS